MIPKDIDKWDNNKWERELAYCKPSSGGAVGVAFAWLGGTAGDRRSGFVDYQINNASFVIKPTQAPAGATKMSEHLLSKLAGASSPKSVAISRRSLSGSGLVMMIKTFRDTEKDPAVKARWREVFRNYDLCHTFLIQEMQKDMFDLSEFSRIKGGLSLFLGNKVFMRNLGKLFAVDALLGIGDRLFNMNTGNVLFKSDGTFCAIDSAAVLTNFKDTLETTVDKFKDELTKEQQIQAFNSYLQRDIHSPAGTMLPKDYKDTLTKINEAATKRGNPAQRVAVIEPMGFAMRKIFDIESWWSGFKTHLLKGREEVVPELIWTTAYNEFLKGFEEGKKEIDRKLSGINWLKLKSKFKGMESKYGHDSNLDLNNLKIRRKYIQLWKRGMKADEAFTTIKEYVKKGGLYKDL